MGFQSLPSPSEDWNPFLSRFPQSFLVPAHLMLRAQTFIQSGIAQSQESCTSGRQASATTCRMYERAQHPPYSDHPPSYYAEGLSTASSSSLASPPSYTCGHAPDELVLLPARGRTGEPSSLRHLQASNSQNLPSEFVYTSKRVTLHLGRRISPTRMPVFGKGASINGLLRISSLDTVESIKIIVEGVITIITMKRSIPNITTSKTFLSRILNVNLPSTVPNQQHFSFTFPSRDDTNSAYLPPTFFAASTDTEVDVRYTVKVHVRRKAFRKQEWLEAPVLYLPASVASIPIQPNSPLQWKQITMLCSLSASSSMCSAQLHLPLPLCYKARKPIPFLVRVSSPNLRSPNVVVSLNKSVAITQHGHRFQASRILANMSGENSILESQSRDARTGSMTYVFLIQGNLIGGKEEGEYVWSSNGVDVTHNIRCSVDLVVSPEETITFRHCEHVELTTHSIEDAIDVTIPALGLMTDTS